METTASSGRHSNQWKPFILVETIPFSWKSFLVVEAIPFIGSHSFYFFIRKAFVFGGNHCPQLKPIFLEETYSF